MIRPGQRGLALEDYAEMTVTRMGLIQRVERGYGDSCAGA